MSEAKPGVIRGRDFKSLLSRICATNTTLPSSMGCSWIEKWIHFKSGYGVVGLINLVVHGKHDNHRFSCRLHLPAMLNWVFQGHVHVKCYHLLFRTFVWKVYKAKYCVFDKTKNINTSHSKKNNQHKFFRNDILSGCICGHLGMYTVFVLFATFHELKSCCPCFLP